MENKFQANTASHKISELIWLTTRLADYAEHNMGIIASQKHLSIIME